jgi:hypothetical protein
MYIKATNGIAEKYPYSIGDLRKDNPQTSFPKNPNDSFLAEWDVFPVEKQRAPDVDLTKTVSEDTPKFVEGKWKQSWKIINRSQEEIDEEKNSLARTARIDRDAMLYASDWVIIKDAEVGVPNIQQWKDYRQALRDVPSQEGFPSLIIWPNKPE